MARLTESLRLTSFLLKGYKQSVEDAINGAIFTQSTNNMVVVRDIELYSLCEHHMLPFFAGSISATYPRRRCSG